MRIVVEFVAARHRDKFADDIHKEMAIRSVKEGAALILFPADKDTTRKIIELARADIYMRDYGVQ